MSDHDDQIRELRHEQALHAAVCEERYKTILNTLASVESQISSLSLQTNARLSVISTRMHGYLLAVASAGVMSTAALTVLILTRGLK